MKPRPRLTQLDGVRGLAMLIVFVYHCGLQWAKGGLLAVDVFFVLSGYLITGLLLSENRRTGTIAFGRFWGRRAVRLLPAMLVMVTTVMLLWRLTAPTAELPAVRSDVIGALLYIANWHFALAGANYFTHGLTPSPMLHMWSLAVEEQFYLLWPLIFWAATRHRTQQGALKAIRLTSTLGLLASSALMATLSLHGVSPSRLYYGTDTRATALLTGTLLATLVPLTPPTPTTPHAARRAHQKATLLGALGCLGAIWLLYYMHTADGQAPWLYRGGFLLIAALAASIIAGAVAAPNGPLAITLRFPPLRALGRVSYGAYLWHWPVILYLTHARTGLSGNNLLALRIAVTVTLAALSWNLLEQPLQRAFAPLTTGHPKPTSTNITPDTPRLRTHKPAWIGLTAITTITTITAITAAAPTNTPPGSASSAFSANASKASTVLPPDANLPLAQRSVRVDLLGDSVAFVLFQYLYRANIAKDYRVALGSDAIIGCGTMGQTPVKVDGHETSKPFAIDCNLWKGIWSKSIVENRPDVAAILVGRWEAVDRLWDGRWQNIVDDPGYAATVVDHLKQAIAIAGSGGAKVALIKLPCLGNGEAADGTPLPEDTPQRVAKYNELLAQASAESTVTTKIFSMDSVLCNADGSERVTDAQGHDLRVAGDLVHPSPAGAVDVGRVLLPQLAAWAREGTKPGTGVK